MLNTPDGQTKLLKASLNASKDVKRQKAMESKEHVARLSKKLDRMKKLPELKKELQPFINKIARLIDKGVPCMMCGIPIKGVANGCHYHGSRSNDPIRFDLNNIHIGDYGCNGPKGGNILGYDERLIEVYGRSYWEYVKFQLVRDHPYCGLRKPDIAEIMIKAKETIKELEKLNLAYPPAMRLKLRTEINKRLNIYK